MLILSVMRHIIFNMSNVRRASWRASTWPPDQHTFFQFKHFFYFRNKNCKMNNDQLFRNKYRIPSARLLGWDYRTSAPYFITICTHKHQCFFGKIENGTMFLNEIGRHAFERIEQISTFSKSAQVVNFVVMPNHVHILFELRNETAEFEPNKFGPLLKGSLSSICNHFKGRVTRYANENKIEFEWQDRFYDNIVRNFEEYERVFKYITDNPMKWDEDKFRNS